MKVEAPHDAALDLPLSRPIAVDSIKSAGQHMDVVADERERQRLVPFLGLASLEKLTARYKVSRDGDHAAISGRIEAELHLVCVVTLEPFAARIAEDVATTFAPAAVVAAMEERLALAQDEHLNAHASAMVEDELPEPISDGLIDLGAATTAFLSLALPPYPRKPGASFAEPAPAQVPQSPFAVLASLKPRPKN